MHTSAKTHPSVYVISRNFVVEKISLYFKNTCREKVTDKKKTSHSFFFFFFPFPSKYSLLEHTLRPFIRCSESIKQPYDKSSCSQGTHGLELGQT